MACAAVATAAILYFATEREAETIATGRPAPEFQLASIDGGTISLAAQRGRLVFLNFWATWCKPCEEEMPAMERLYRALPREDFELLAISVDTEFVLGSQR